MTFAKWINSLSLNSTQQQNNSHNNTHFTMFYEVQMKWWRQNAQQRALLGNKYFINIVVFSLHNVSMLTQLVGAKLRVLT